MARGQGPTRGRKEPDRREFDDVEKRVLFCVTHILPPVSLDSLCALSGVPATRALDVMERLKSRKIVHEKSGYPKGTYFFRDEDIERLDGEPPGSRQTKRMLERLVHFNRKESRDGERKTLIMADLCRRLGDREDGLRFVSEAARILKDRGEWEDALASVSYLVDTVRENGLSRENVDYVLEGLLGKLQLSMASMNSHEVEEVLGKLRDVARLYKREHFIARAQLDLGLHLLARQENRKAERWLRKTIALARKLQDQSLLRSATLLMSEARHWKGEVQGGFPGHEETAEHGEDLGDDETALVAKARQGLWYVMWGKIARGIGIIEAVRAKSLLLDLRPTVFFCDLMAAHAYLELRKTKEAEFYLDRASSLLPDRFGPFVLRIMNLIKAYILFRKMDFEGAFRCHQQAAEQAKATLMMNHKAGWVFEYVGGLEQKGLVHHEASFEREAARAIHGEDMHMKGVGLRYAAVRALNSGAPIKGVLADLRKSEECLKKAGTEIELARTRTALAEAYLKERNYRMSGFYKEKVDGFLAGIGKEDLFPEDLSPAMQRQRRIETIADAMIDINDSLAGTGTASHFLGRALDFAMDLTQAGRGAFFEADGKEDPRIMASRNLEPALLSGAQRGLMNAIVTAVAESRTEAHLPGPARPFPISEDAVLSAGITSLLCVPSRLGDHVAGCLYLDNRPGGEPFGRAQLPYIRLLCSQIAIGLCSTDSYEETREPGDRSEAETIPCGKEVRVSTPLEGIIGASRAIENVKALIRRVAPTDASVLIVGETGVGKELVARAIHNLSQRREGPLISVNLVSFPQELVASELFGHEQGAFTGAKERHRGRFELADGGTLFLDEVADLPLNIQAKLLRVLQEGTFERLGSGKALRSNFRLIAATNRDLAREVEKGTFRQDLYYRLNVFPIDVPPLRERRGDIPLISSHFLGRCGHRMGKRMPPVPRDEIKRLLRYQWPGNVRELEHFIERAVIISDGTRIDFSELDRLSGAVLPDSRAPAMRLKDVEKEHIKRALRASGWKVNGPGGAASMLGLKPTTLFSMMKRLGIGRRYDE